MALLRLLMCGRKRVPRKTAKPHLVWLKKEFSGLRDDGEEERIFVSFCGHMNEKIPYKQTMLAQKKEKHASLTRTSRTKKEKAMASSVISSSISTVNRASPAQMSAVAPLGGLKSLSGFPVTRKPYNDISTPAAKVTKVRCMQVWPPVGKKFFETLSYLPPLTPSQLAREVDYLLRKGWVPCLEFELEKGFPYRENNRTPGYYDGRYWTMWKLPMFGCTDSAQVLKELEECKKEYPVSFIRIIGFDNVRQVQCISFIAHRPKGF
ncbi:hypothetical protein VNO77_35011 [Canavalia gladiata]|uniref:Ribulose bisphosphate carboxylase small subunit, chloroplastic n=1 Tax=Canavalia gladiata TaxID=3824 RepID=A0AAN9PYT6_CANGL